MAFATCETETNNELGSWLSEKVLRPVLGNKIVDAANKAHEVITREAERIGRQVENLPVIGHAVGQVARAGQSIGTIQYNAIMSQTASADERKEYRAKLQEGIKNAAIVVAAVATGGLATAGVAAGGALTLASAGTMASGVLLAGAGGAAASSGFNLGQAQFVSGEERQYYLNKAEGDAVLAAELYAGSLVVNPTTYASGAVGAAAKKGAIAVGEYVLAPMAISEISQAIAPPPPQEQAQDQAPVQAPIPTIQAPKNPQANISTGFLDMSIGGIPIWMLGVVTIAGVYMIAEGKSKIQK